MMFWDADTGLSGFVETELQSTEPLGGNQGGEGRSD